MKTVSFDQIKDKYIGKPGTAEREQYELELQVHLLGGLIRDIRKQRNLTQEELGNLIGVQKAQVSKIESDKSNMTIETLVRVLRAMDAKVQLRVELA